MKINPIFEKHLEAYRLRAFEVYRLSHTSPDVVFEWLREQKPMFGFLGGADPDIVDMLIKRDEPLINLGLALYATIHDDDHALNLYRNGDTTIKRAMLTGPSVGLAPFKRWINADSETLRGLLQSFDDNPQLLGSLFSNESIDPNLLVLLYERQEPFNELTDEQWILAITATAFNPIFSRTPRTSDDWERKRALEAAWKLFEVLPVNAESARILSRLGWALSFFPYAVAATIHT